MLIPTPLLPHSTEFEIQNYTLEHIEDQFLKAVKIGINRKQFSSRQADLIFEAAELAKDIHKGQKREEGPPYVIHAIETAINEINNGGNTESICEALWHDTLEMTDLGREKSDSTLIKLFGHRRIVQDLRLLSNMSGNKKLPDEKYLPIATSTRSTLHVKTSDIEANLNGFGRMVLTQPIRVQEQIKKVQSIVLPIVLNHGEYSILQRLYGLTTRLQERLDYATQWKLINPSINDAFDTKHVTDQQVLEVLKSAA